MESAKEVIDALLEYGSRSAIAAKWGLLDLRERLRDEKNRVPLFELWAHRAVVSIMRAHAVGNADVAELCCDAVELICVTPEHRFPMIELGIGTLIVQTLTAHPDSLAVTNSALAAAWNVSLPFRSTVHVGDDEDPDSLVETEDRVDALIELRLGEALVNATRKHIADRNVAYRGCGAIWRLISGEPSRTKMFGFGAADVTIDSMNMHASSSAMVAETGAEVLFEFVSNVDNVPALVKLGAVRVVIDAMMMYSMKKEAIARAGCGFISRVASTGDDRRTELMDAGAGTAIVAAMTSFAETKVGVAGFGCGALCELALLSPHVSILLNAGAGEAVMGALTAWSEKDEDVFTNGTNALVRFAADKNHRARLVMMGAGKFLLAAGHTDALERLLNFGHDPPLSALECSVCKERTEKYALEKCGHVFCSDCADAAIEKKACHNCRKDSAKKIRLFL